jgi:hypothetical protein
MACRKYISSSCYMSLSRFACTTFSVSTANAPRTFSGRSHLRFMFVAYHACAYQGGLMRRILCTRLTSVHSRSSAILGITVTILLLFTGQVGIASAAHSAYVAVAHDPLLNDYTGTSHPSGTYQINLAGNVPGYLNGISGGQNAGSAGGLISTRFAGNQVLYLMGIAIHVTDTAGTSHSLSALNDPALTDIVSDLNNPPFGGDFVPIAYAYNNAPSQYSMGEAALSAGESANGGQPFDILMVGIDNNFVFPDAVWSLGFADEVGNLDGITALSVTDVGLLAPEPSSAMMLGVILLIGLYRRRPK